jgi:hypothetical protein
MNLRIFLRDRTPIKAINEIHKPGDNEICFTILGEGSERDLDVLEDGRFEASPQIAGDIKAIPGVVEVQSYNAVRRTAAATAYSTNNLKSALTKWMGDIQSIDINTSKGCALSVNVGDMSEDQLRHLFDAIKPTVYTTCNTERAILCEKLIELIEQLGRIPF